MKLVETLRLEDVFHVQCFDKNGLLKWEDDIFNAVVDEGVNDALDKYFKGSNYTAAHYCGLTDGTPTFSASDTMASHSGWVEVTAYTATTRPAISWGTVASKAVTSSAMQFTINAAGTTVGGCFVCTGSTKGGTTDILYGGGAFSQGDRTLGDGDVLNVTVTATGASA